MTSASEVMFELVKSAVWERTCCVPDQANWAEVFLEMHAQTLLTLPMDLLGTLNMPHDIKAKWFERALKENSRYYQILYLHNELHALFEEHQIEYAVLKGLAAACYYPRPAYRMFGDIDILLQKDTFEKALQLLAAHGYSVDEKAQRHVVMKKYGIEIELHHRFSDRQKTASAEKQEQQLDAWIAEGLAADCQGCLDECHFRMLPPVQNGIVLLQHIKRHLLTSGLGLRQIVDWMMFVHHELDDAVWQAEFQPTAKQFGLEQLAITVTRLCQMYLGLSERYIWCQSADESLCRNLMNEFAVNGNFGKKRGKVSQTTSVLLRMKNEGFFKSLQRSGIHNWRACQKHPWLQPFAWLYQTGWLVRKGLRLPVAQARKSVRSYLHRRRLMDQLGL